MIVGTVYGWAFGLPKIFGLGISGFRNFGFPKMIPEISWKKEEPENSGSGSGLPELPDFLTLHICNRSKAATLQPAADRRRRLGDGAPRQETGSARAPRGGGLARDAETGRGGVGGGSASDAPTRRPAGARMRRSRETGSRADPSSWSLPPDLAERWRGLERETERWLGGERRP